MSGCYLNSWKGSILSLSLWNICISKHNNFTTDENNLWNLTCSISELWNQKTMHKTKKVDGIFQDFFRLTEKRVPQKSFGIRRRMKRKAPHWSILNEDQLMSSFSLLGIWEKCPENSLAWTKPSPYWQLLPRWVAFASNHEVILIPNNIFGIKYQTLSMCVWGGISFWERAK